MKRAAGFTLIELVIVIVILGILGAVAAPRFFNLQGDAYGANLNALRTSISSAATMANAKAQLAGKGLDETPTVVTEYDSRIKLKYGFPIADVTANNAVTTKGEGILAALDGFDYDRYNLTTTSGELNRGELKITPKSINDTTNCVVIYTEASKTGSDPIRSATVTAKTDGC